MSRKAVPRTPELGGRNLDSPAVQSTATAASTLFRAGCRAFPRHTGRHALVIGLLLAGAQLVRAASVGDIAPNFQLPATRDPQSGAPTVRLADLRGKVVYLDFWASWCGPCKQSFPWMNDVQSRYASKGLEVLAIDVDTHSEDARAFLAALPPRFRVAFDAQGVTPRQYAIRGMPTSILIGADGKVLLVHNGFRTDDTAAVEASIQSALAHMAN